MFDLRLLPLALGLWFGSAAVCLTAGLGNERTLQVAAGVGLIVPLVLFVVRTIAARMLEAEQKWVDLVRSAISVMVVGLVVGTSIATLRVLPIHAEPLRGIVADALPIEGQARLLEAPKTKSRADGISDKSGAVTWWVQADLVELTVKSTTGIQKFRLSVPVSLRGMADDADVLTPLVPGSTVAFTGRAQPGLPARPQAASVMVGDKLRTVAAAPAWQQWGAAVRASMKAVAANVGGAGGNLLPGLVAGDESQLDEHTVLAMRDTGLAHLTAVSGSNIAVVTGLVLALCFGLRLPRRLSLAAAFVAMLGFVVVVGAQPSVLRATAMATIVLVALALKRDRDTIPSLLLAVAALLIIDPWLALSLGFALSVCATSGIILAGKFYEQSERDFRAKIKAAVIVTIAAQVSTTPIIAGMGNGLPLIGIVSNLLAMPAVPVATIVGLASAGLGLLHLGVGQFLAQIAAVPAQWIATVAITTNKIPGGLIAWPGGIWSVVTTTLMTAALLLAWGFRRKLGKQLVLGVVVLVLVAAGFYASDPLRLEGRWLPSNWSAVVCDVGQGDASVIKTGESHAIVIDVGASDEPVDSCLRELGVNTIDLMILTHFHADHVGGLGGALARRQVNKILGSPLADPPGQTGRVRKIIADRGMHIETARPGQAFTLGHVKLEILWPFELIHSQGSAPNNASVVSKVTMPGLSILFPGDVEPEAQARIIESQPSLGIDVIKVPHHGSKNQSPDLPAWAGAKWAVMSAGVKNRYGHPNPSTIGLFESAGAKVVRTDTMGSIALVAGGSGSDLNILVKGIEGRRDP